ncbi:HIRAN domain-containing protein [Kluyvera intermedia]|uniref:HIRAN domain-containing protein n=1 Tax=Kluyvera intermedia TaxID=61648 RepID=UPI003B9E2549
MPIQLIDVSDWRRDDEHGIFPIGARDKKMLWSPQKPLEGVRPSWPYLFKSSRDAYPDQFWMETIAYIVGEAMGIEVPKAMPAVRVGTDGLKEYGALLEWFYDKDREHFVHASDIFHLLNKDFDDASGRHHNLEDLRLICRTLSIHGIIHSDWTEWLSDMLLLDSFIGNSDRHQENWGFVFYTKRDVDGKVIRNDEGKIVTDGKLSPCFDNGTSLGHERFPERVAAWNLKSLDKYIQKGNHHLRRNRAETRERLGHLQSVQELVLDPVVLAQLQKRLSFNIDELCGTIRALTGIAAEDGSLALPRAEWVIRLLRRRHTRLKLITNMRTINHIVEPSRLWLTWQPAGGGSRYVVGYIDRVEGDQYTFTYNLNTTDFETAVEKGFKGHPAFQLKQQIHSNNVLEPFLRRLPPRKRKDFAEYLVQHLLPVDFSGSDFALLGYTGAKSPADGFCLINDPAVFEKSCELLLEVAGTRYQEGLDLSAVSVGDPVEFVHETDNPHDAHAVAVMHAVGRLGYINKVHCKAVKDKARTNKLHAFVAKKNGTSARPLVYLLVECE